MDIIMNLSDFKKFINDAEKSSYEFSKREEILSIRFDNRDIDILNEEKNIVANINTNTKKITIY